MHDQHLRHPSRRKVLRYVAGAASLVPLAAVTGCGSDSGRTLRVSYQQFGSGKIMRNHLESVAAQFSKTRPDITVELVPLVAAENDYFTKNELMMSSARTACDLVYEDTFILKSDVAAGYLRPIDHLLEKWPMWQQFYPITQTAVRAEDGKHYGVPIFTDTRAIWHNEALLAKAGIPTPWQPRTWADILTAARAVKKRLPGVIPINIYAGKASGEKTSMQGFEMLLYGTQSTLYDEKRKKWVLGSKGFVDSLAMIRTIYAEKLGPPTTNALDPNLSELITGDLFPHGKLAMAVDGCWIGGAWGEGGAAAWPEAFKTLKLAKMPTQHGEAPGLVTLSGGFSWAMPAKASQPELAWQFLDQMMGTQNMTDFAIADNQISVRRDIAAQPRYKSASPTVKFFTDLVKDTTYRPALAPYPQISNAIQIAAESVMLGSATPQAAAKAYDAAVLDIVGASETMREA